MLLIAWLVHSSYKIFMVILARMGRTDTFWFEKIRVILHSIAYGLFAVFMLRLRKILIFMQASKVENDETFLKNRLCFLNCMKVFFSVTYTLAMA